MNQSHSGWHGVAWHRCDRCGQEFPVTLLVRQRGSIFCTPNNCVDNPLIWNRPGIIQEVLEFGQDQEMAVADILRDNLNTDMEDEFI